MKISSEQARQKLLDKGDLKRETKYLTQMALGAAGPDEILPGFKKPHEVFCMDDVEDWKPLILELAKRNMNAQAIAGLIGCAPHQARKDLAHIIREGHARYRLTVENGLYTLATLSEDHGEDSIERANIRTTKLKALQIMKAAIDRSDAFVPPEEQEKLRRLSDEELAAAIKEAASRL